MKEFYTDINLREHKLKNVSLDGAVLEGAQANDIVKVDSNGKLTSGPLSLVTDETLTNGTIALLKAGYNYTITSSISTLSVTAVEDGTLESNVFFVVSGSNFRVTMPTGVKCIGEKPAFESGKQYVMSYYRNTVVFGKLNSL